MILFLILFCETSLCKPNHVYDEIIKVLTFYMQIEIMKK